MYIRFKTSNLQVVSHLLKLIGSEDENVQEAAADCLQNIRYMIYKEYIRKLFAKHERMGKSKFLEVQN